MELISLSKLRNESIKVVKRFPLAFLFNVLLSIYAIYIIYAEDVKGVPIYYLTSGVLLSILTTLWQEEYHNKRVSTIVTVVAHLALLADAVRLWFNADGMDVYIARAAVYTAMIIGICFVPFYKEKTDYKSWNFVQHLAASLSVCFIVGLLMFIGSYILMIGIDALFNLNIKYQVYLTLCILCMQTLPISMFLAKIPEGSDKHMGTVETAPFLTGVTRFLFIPLSLAYMVILYIYMGIIITTGELPKGMVSVLVTTMMAALIIINFLHYPLFKSGQAQRYDRMVYSVIPLATVPLLILMTIGTLYRWNEYGITVNRLYLITLNVWFYIVCIGLWITKANRIHWIPLSFGAILLLTSAQPLNYCQITRYSMSSYLEDIIAQYPTPSEKMNKAKLLEWIDTLPEEEQDKVYSQLSYLNSYFRADAERWINKEVYLPPTNYETNAKQDKKEDYYVPWDAEYIINYHCKQSGFPIPEGYTYGIRNYISRNGSKDSLLTDDSLVLPLEDNYSVIIDRKQIEEAARDSSLLPFYPESTLGEQMLIYIQNCKVQHFKSRIKIEGTFYLFSRKDLNE